MRTLLALFLLSTVSPTFCQDPPEERTTEAPTEKTNNSSNSDKIVFAFVHQSTETEDTDISDVDASKKERAEAVYNRLVKARGDYRYPVPDFVMTKTRGSVAWMNYNANQIGIEEDAYDVCLTMGQDADAAIAFLLGHELSHFYEKHAWRRQFVSNFSDLDIGENLSGINDSVMNETQADYIGGFLAFSAGFPVFERGGELTRALYKEYGLPDKLPIYPHLDDRVTLAKRSAKKIVELANIYETANLLTIIGRYEHAAYYYQHVLQDYQSSSVYNNAGVMSLLAAMAFLPSHDSTYVLPIQLDLTSIDHKGAEDKGTKLVKAAIRHFDAAINLDPGYAPAYLNKACAYMMLPEKDMVRARYFAEVEALNAANKNKAYTKTVNDVKILLGILHAEEGDKQTAEKLFTEAMAADSTLAKENLRILRREPKPDIPDDTGAGLSLKPETIDSINLALEAEELPVNYRKRRSAGPGLAFYQNPKVGPASKLLVHQDMNENGMPKTFFLSTKPGYTGTSAKRVAVGDPESKVIRRYKRPDKTIETTNGRLLKYNNIIFYIDGEGKVSGWTIYIG